VSPADSENRLRIFRCDRTAGLRIGSHIRLWAILSKARR
jgi:hypothetical protein